MTCPNCQNYHDRVVDSRHTTDAIRRRRQCLKCKHKWTTYEMSEDITRGSAEIYKQAVARFIQNVQAAMNECWSDLEMK